MLDRTRATCLAEALALDVDAIGICHACLWFVSHALESGDDHEISAAVSEFAPFLWDEGLALPVRLALEKAIRRGAPDAEAAIQDVAARGARSPIVHAIVRRLGNDLLLRLASLPAPPSATVTRLEARPEPA